MSAVRLAAARSEDRLARLVCALVGPNDEFEEPCTVASIIAVGAIGLTGTVPGWFGGAGDSGFTNHNSDLPSRQTLRA